MFVIVFGLLILLSACASAPPTGPDAARTLVDESAASMGGWAALDAVKSQELIVFGGDLEPEQAVQPNGEARIVNRFSQTIVADFEKNRIRLFFDAIREYPNTLPIKFTEVIDGDAGMLETADAKGVIVRERLHPSRMATRQRDVRRLPVRLLYTAKNAADVTRVEDRKEGNLTLQIIRFKDGDLPVEIHFDSFNKLPLRVIYTEDDPIYGDALNELAFSEWRDYSGVRLPQVMAFFMNGAKIREERARNIINNPKYDEAGFAIPDDIRAQSPNGQPIVSQWPLRRIVMGVGYVDFGREQKVDLVEVAKGVYHAKGGSHHSLAIEMSDHVVVVEAPLFEERSVAVINAIEAKIPGKPIRHVAMTHFHIDHSGGLRAYAAKGATIQTHEANVEFVKTVMSRPKTIRPDSLAKAGSVTPSIEGVKGVKSLSDGTRTVELREIPNAHSAGMLVAYLPNEKIVFVSDLYTPGAAVDPTNRNGIDNAAALHSALTGAKLSVDRIVGGHGETTSTLAELAKIAAMKAGS
jgi:glyoxylase-like metal-dependent hydrolase (beta-lactamase superfamily II)